jgi:hypothetical protein
VTLRFFLRRPLPLRSRDSHYLDVLGRHLAVSLTPDAFCSLQHIGPRCPEEAIDSDHPPQTYPETVLTAKQAPPASHRTV